MQYKELTAAGTFTLKSGAGYLQGIIVNLPGTTPTLQIFDNTAASGAAIAGGTAFAAPAAGSPLRYDCHFSNGLTIVVGGSGTMSYTVCWY